MGDWGSEFLSSRELVSDAVKKLHQLDPQNELLKWWLIMPDEAVHPRFESEEQRRELMKKRFWERAESWKGLPADQVWTIIYSNYLSALEKRIERIERIRYRRKTKKQKH